MLKAARQVGVLKAEPEGRSVLKSTGGRARTDTVLSHHRILSPSWFVYLCSRLFENPLIYAEFS
jgi:hypothetical protein